MVARETIESFEQFINLPENADKLFEYIGGRIVEVPSNPYVSEIAATIIFFIKLFLRENGMEGHVTGEAGGYMVAGERYAPDVAYISHDRQLELAKQGYNPNPPELAVEVVSSDRAEELNDLRIKVTNYLAVGTTVWVVKPEEKLIEVHKPGQPVKLYLEHETLKGNDILPGFAVQVKELFP